MREVFQRQRQRLHAARFFVPQLYPSHGPEMDCLQYRERCNCIDNGDNRANGGGILSSVERRPTIDLALLVEDHNHHVRLDMDKNSSHHALSVSDLIVDVDISMYMCSRSPGGLHPGSPYLVTVYEQFIEDYGNLGDPYTSLDDAWY